MFRETCKTSLVQERRMILLSAEINPFWCHLCAERLVCVVLREGTDKNKRKEWQKFLRITRWKEACVLSCAVCSQPPQTVVHTLKGCVVIKSTADSPGCVLSTFVHHLRAALDFTAVFIAMKETPRIFA